MNSKIFTKLIIVTVLILCGCEFQDVDSPYKEQITVYANIQANLPMMDTLYVSRTAAIGEEIDADQLWISNAVVKISDGQQSEIAFPVLGRPGRYLTRKDYVYKPETKYSLIVEANGQTLTAETTTPEKMVIESVKDATYRCKGESIPVAHINTNNITFTESGLVPTGDIDTVMYRSGECFTESFASYPFFEIDFNAEDYSTVRILSLALEDKEWGLEPKDMDYNSNGFRDSTYINLIYDTTRVYTIWKGPYYRDEDNNPYRQNPFFWTVETSPVNMSWLFFNYYGLQLIVFQAEDGIRDTSVTGVQTCALPIWKICG